MNALIPIIMGISIGLMVAFDPLLSIWADNTVNLQIGGYRLLRLYPFELTTIFFITIILTIIICARFKDHIYSARERILITLLVASPQFKAISIGFIDILDIFILAFILLWLLDIREDGMIVLNTPLQLIVILIVLSLMLSVINGGPESLVVLLRITKTIVYGFILINLVRRLDNLIWLFKSLFIILALSSLIAIIQEVLFLTAHMLILGNVSARALDLMFQNTFFGRILRPPAFFGYPQAFARILSFTIPILLLFLIDPGMRRHFKLKPYLLCLALMSVALLFTYSRPSWIGAVAGIVMFTYIRRPYLVIHSAVALLFIIAFGLITGLAENVQQMVYEEIKLGGDLQDRLTLAKESIEKIDRHLFIGGGIGKGSRLTANVHNWPAHNAFILSIVNTGLIGFVLYSFSFVLIYFRLLPAIFFRDDMIKVITLGMISGISAYLISIQFMTGFMGHGYFIYIIAPSAVLIYHYYTKRIDRGGYPRQI
jgi:O-antigen ligase